MTTFTHTEETKKRISATKRKTCSRGENHRNSILTDDKVLKIVDLYRENHVPQRQLADMYGVSKGTITAILYGWTWGHVTGIIGRREQVRSRV